MLSGSRGGALPLSLGGNEIRPGFIFSASRIAWARRKSSAIVVLKIK